MGVVIVGAGPTGLTLACGLRAAGVSVRVLDAAAGPATTSRALGLQPRGVEVLTRIGALADLPQHGLPIRSVAVTVDGRALATLRVGEPTRLGGPRALLMSQALIERALRDRFEALGGHVEWGRRVTAVAQSAGGADVRLDEGTSVEAEWVVGADGAHSAVRRAAGFAFPGVPVAERFWLADVHTDLDRRREAVSVWLRGERLLAAFPLPGDDLWRLMAPAPPEVTTERPAEIIDYLSARLAAEAGAAVISAEWTSSFRIQRRLADAYRRGRVLLAGDAAHIHSPIGGQGLNTGIGDAENLAWKLTLVVTGRAGEALLDTYEAERRPIAEEVLSSTTGLTRLITGNGRKARVLRDHVFVPLLNRPWVQQRIAEKSSQLTLSYRRGPWGDRKLIGPSCGDRVADRTCIRADGTTTRLHSELGPQWVLLGSPHLAEIAAARLGDVIALRFGDGGTLDPALSPAMLVRPDGHLAWRGTDASDLVRRLDVTLGTRPRALTR